MMRRRAVVEELVALGAAVHTCSNHEAELCEQLKQWEARGLQVTGSLCDISSQGQRENLVREVTDRFCGKIDILVSLVPNSYSPCSKIIVIIDFFRYI